MTLNKHSFAVHGEPGLRRLARDDPAASGRKRWAKIAAVVVGLPILGIFVAWLLFARGLPSAERLLNYQPPLPTNVRDINGEPVQSFARERRVELAYRGISPAD